MKKYFHNKLIRDKIPDIIFQKGESCEINTLPDTQYINALKKKLIEEANEVFKSSDKDLAKELSDVLELIKSIGKYNNIKFSEIQNLQIKRNRERGGYKKKIFLVWSSEPAGK